MLERGNKRDSLTTSSLIDKLTKCMSTVEFTRLWSLHSYWSVSTVCSFLSIAYKMCYYPFFRKIMIVDVVHFRLRVLFIDVDRKSMNISYSAGKLSIEIFFNILPIHEMLVRCRCQSEMPIDHSFEVKITISLSWIFQAWTYQMMITLLWYHRSNNLLEQLENCHWFHQRWRTKKLTRSRQWVGQGKSSFSIAVSFFSPLVGKSNDSGKTIITEISRRRSLMAQSVIGHTQSAPSSPVLLRSGKNRPSHARKVIDQIDAVRMSTMAWAERLLRICSRDE